ncbi:MAG TPA: hypothetical protein VK468_01885, partial [Pyrinomonadaceae bacterium]|nr:hypothetical protein [Pyrinomonadaceae bacterium]
EIPNKLRERSEALRSLSSEIDRLPRANASSAYSSLIKRIAYELDSLTLFYPKAVEALAMCTRNIFELNLIVRHTLADPANLAAWLGQCIGDEKDVIEGVLKLVDSPIQARGELNQRLLELDSISKRFGIQSAKPFNVRKLADNEGLLKEYDSLFKIYSKYVHPSSWIVNSPDNEGFLTPADAANIFIIHSQIYAEDSHVKIRGWLAKDS